MIRISAPARMVAMIAAILVLPLLALVAPAQADDPGVTPTHVGIYPDNLLDDDTTLYLGANIFCCNGRDDGITGSFTFRDDTGATLASGVVPSLENGYAVIYVPKPTRPTTYYVDFHGTNGFGDSSTSTLYTPSSRRTVNVTPEPTLMRITAGALPQLTLTLSAYARFKDGTPTPGVRVSFEGMCLVESPRMCASRVHWCSAVTDANGFASCKGAGLLAAVVSVLNGEVWMYAYSTNQYHVQVTNAQPPVVVRS